MAKKFYKALEPITLDREYRPGDTFEADSADVAGKDVIDLSANQTPAAGTAPTDPAERIAAIITAIGQIDPTDADLFTGAGVPKTESIIAITGWPVSAKERDAAWAQINATK